MCKRKIFVESLVLMVGTRDKPLEFRKEAMKATTENYRPFKTQPLAYNWALVETELLPRNIKGLYDWNCLS